MTAPLDAKSNPRVFSLEQEDPNKTPASNTKLGFTLKMSSPGFKNLRAMFEQSKAQPSSGSESPNRDISPKPLSRVRTSFVAVAGNGAVGLVKAGSPTAGITDANLAGAAVEGDKSVPEAYSNSNKEDEAPLAKAEEAKAAIEEVGIQPDEKPQQNEQTVQVDSPTPSASKVTEQPASGKPSLKAASEPKAHISKDTLKDKPKRPTTATKSGTDKTVEDKKVPPKSALEKKVTEKPAKATERPVKTIEKPVKTVEKPVKTVERPVKATEKPVKAEKSVKATEKPTEEKKNTEKRTTTTATKPVTRPSSSRPSTAPASRPASMPPPATKPIPKNLALLPKKTPASTPLPSPRVPITPKTATATKHAPRHRAPDKSSTTLTARAATVIGHRSGTPGITDATRRTTSTLPSTSRLFAPTAASQARVEEKGKPKTVASSTASKRPSSVAAARPKSSLGTARYGESKVTVVKPVTTKKPVAKSLPAETPVASQATIPPPPPEEVLERVTRPTTASASKAVTKEELAEIHSRSTSRTSGTHSRRVSVGSSVGSGMGSPGTRRMSSHSPPRSVISPAHGLSGEEPSVIEENEEEQEEKPQSSATIKEDGTTRPATLQLNGSEKIEANDVNSPTSETTLVHEGEPESEVVEKTGEGEEAAEVTITV